MITEKSCINSQLNLAFIVSKSMFLASYAVSETFQAHLSSSHPISSRLSLRYIGPSRILKWIWSKKGPSADDQEVYFQDVQRIRN